MRTWLARLLALSGILAAALLFAGLSALFLPFQGAPRIWPLQDYVQPENPAERAALIQAQIEASAVFVQLVGGALLLVTVFTALATSRQTQKSLAIAQEGQITERFTRAIEQLGACDEHGKARLELRLGGIYALERIARDSLRDNGPIMEVLTAYVRENSPLPPDDQERPDITTDVQAVLTVIGRRGDAQRQGQAINLERTNLKGAHLEGSHLEGAHLRAAHLEGADLSFAHLGEADLSFAHLKGAELHGAHLEEAELHGAHLEEAKLHGAHLEGANFYEAYMERAYLFGADLERASLVGAHLEGAYLKTAHLNRAHLWEARLERANLERARFGQAILEKAHLEGARLEGADLRAVRDLTQEQIDATSMDEQTRLPQGLGPDGKPYRRSTRMASE